MLVREAHPAPIGRRLIGAGSPSHSQACCNALHGTLDQGLKPHNQAWSETAARPRLEVRGRLRRAQQVCGDFQSGIVYRPAVARGREVSWLCRFATEQPAVVARATARTCDRVKRCRRGASCRDGSYGEIIEKRRERRADGGRRSAGTAMYKQVPEDSEPCRTPSGARAVGLRRFP